MERVVSQKLKGKAAVSFPAPQTMKSLLRDKKFALLYVKEPNATKCAIAVGLAPRSAPAEGCKLLKKPNVQALILHYRQQMEDRTAVTVEKLLKELGKVAFASMQDYYLVDQDGQPRIDFSNLTPEQWAAIGEISVEEFMDGPPGRERPVRRTKFKLHDKLGAIDKAMRHLGGYAKGADGGGEEVTVNNTTVYTLNIGSANVLVSKQDAPPLLEG